MFAQLYTATAIAQSSVFAPMVDLPDVNPDMNSPMALTAVEIAGIVFGVCTIIATLGIVVCGLMLVFGGVSPRMKEEATKGLIWSIIGTIVLGSATGLTQWGLNVGIF